ncbi:hypothetical protein ISS312_03277 [Alteromonas mediterranea]|nr:hypothetical protein ISS312_03277 [Alteromonas mediterranea]
MLAFFRFWWLDTKKQDRSPASIYSKARRGFISSQHGRSGLKTSLCHLLQDMHQIAPL